MSAIPIPQSKPKQLLLGLLLVDLPVFLAIAVIGVRHGFVATYEDISAWRMAHPWSFAPSVLVVVLLVRRWRGGR